ncbi:MAG: FtsH protease activity modulator HflK [Alphaproteobacteria bacterium]|nr:FtsH protease activity modulator HflK [Alphaproteobacteria bacterium]
MNWNNDEGPWGSSQGAGKSQTPPQKDSKKDDESSPYRFTRPPQSGGPQDGPPFPDFDELLQKLKAMAATYKPKGHLPMALWVLGAFAALWLLSGFYMVAANQVGVVMRFGAYTRTENPGLRYHLPAPIERVLLPVVTAQNEIQIGFRKLSGERVTLKPEESMMLTQDENIINVQYTVFWQVNNANDFLFEIRDPEITVKMAAESVMREVIGQNRLQFALTEGRGQIAEDARKRLQDLLNEYRAGVFIKQINLQTVAVPDEVKAAFQDVVNARLDMERFQNQAAAHVNKVIPEAHGEAAKLVQSAMAYRDQKIAVAKGDADRFREVLAAYGQARNVTSRRLYLETMEDVLSKASKVVTDNMQGTVPLYPLQDLMRKKQEETSP